MLNRPDFQSAISDFHSARLRASMQAILARLTGKSNELLSYEEVEDKLKLRARSDRGRRDIPLDAIVGSVGRYSDFTRTFLPRKDENAERWAKVKSAIDDPGGMGLPPIDVYKVGEVYFVLDGNHRVSVARREGFETIEANVIEVQTDIPLTPDVQPDDLITKAEYADFLEVTEIKRLRPDAELSVTVPGQYQKLLEHIAVHQYFMGLDFQRDIPYPEAVGHWYDTVYMPLIEIVRERGLLHWFPDRTETDLYLWVAEHRAALESELGWSIRPDAALADLATRENPRAGSEAIETGSWRQSKMYDRYTDRLFQDVLVSISGKPESWPAVEQAILIAQKESATLHGLHVIPLKADAESSESVEIREKFNNCIQEAGVQGNLATVKGSVPEQVCERALLTDLVVLNVAHPPEPGLPGLGSGLRSIIWQSARPILTVPGQVSSLDNALVAFDDSEKSKEALFVAAYLAERWKTHLTVLTVSDNGHLSASAQDYARSYLDLHEIHADYLVEKGPMDIFPKIMQERGTNLVLMGGYGGTVWQELVIGSLVNFLLREARNCPLFICR